MFGYKIEIDERVSRSLANKIKTLELCWTWNLNFRKSPHTTQCTSDGEHVCVYMQTLEQKYTPTLYVCMYVCGCWTGHGNTQRKIQKTTMPYPEGFHKFLRQICFVCIVSSNLYGILFTICVCVSPRQQSPGFFDFIFSILTIHFRSFALNIFDRHAIKKLTLMGLATFDAYFVQLHIVCVCVCVGYLSVFGWRFWHTGQYSIEAVVKFYARCLCIAYAHSLRNDESFHNQENEQQHQEVETSTQKRKMKREQHSTNTDSFFYFAWKSKRKSTQTCSDLP